MITRRNRFQDTPIWRRTMKAFKYYFSRDFTNQKRSDDLRKHKPTKLPPKAERLVKQAVGCLASVVAVVKSGVLGVSDVLEECGNVLKKEGDVLYMKVVRKQIVNDIVHAYAPNGAGKFDCRDEIELALIHPWVQDYYKLW